MASGTGTGDLLSSLPLVEGEGTVTQHVSGIGALVLSLPLVSGQGSKGVVGTGALSGPVSSLSGNGQKLQHLVGSGALTAPRATLSASTFVPDNTIWETDNRPWGSADFAYADNKPVMLIGNEFYQADSDLRFGEVPLRVVLMRSGLTIMGRDRFGNWKSDPSTMKTLQKIWPIIRGVPGTIINVYAGAQDSTDDPIRWEGPFRFVVGTTRFCDFLYVTGCYLAVRFESQDAEPWELLSYDLDLEIVGESA